MGKRKGVKGRFFDNILLFLLYWVVLQDFVLSLVYKVTGNYAFTTLLLYGKEIIFALLCAYVILLKRLPVNMFATFIGITLCVVFSFAMSIVDNPSSLGNLLQNVRSIMILPGFIVIGYSITDVKGFGRKIVKRFFPFLVFCAVVGLLEFYADKLIGTKNFWYNTMGITEYYSDIKLQESRLINGLPGNFYGDYGHGFFSQKRLVGFWMVPLTAAYTLLMPAIYYLIRVLERRGRDLLGLICFAILATAILLTHTRAIWIVLIVAFAVLLVLYVRSVRVKIILFLAMFAAALYLFIFRTDELLSIMFDTSTSSHILSMQNSLASGDIGLFGKGLNRLGVYGEVNTESTYISLLGNIGIVGFLFYIVMLLGCVFSLIAGVNKSRGGHALIMTAIISSSCYLFTGFISEQLFAYTTIMPFYLILGFCCRLAPYERRKAAAARSVAVAEVTNTPNVN